MRRASRTLGRCSSRARVRLSWAMLRISNVAVMVAMFSLRWVLTLAALMLMSSSATMAVMSRSSPPRSQARICTDTG